MNLSPLDSIPAEHPGERSCSAFAGYDRIAAGRFEDVVAKAKERIDQGEPQPVIILDDATSELIEVDFAGTPADVRVRIKTLGNQEGIAPAEGHDQKRGPGRPKLGVVGREVTLLPRHWDWLDDQPGGPSVALRRIVEEARRTHQGRDQARRSADAVHRFMWTLTGDLPGFEEASRAFYRKDLPKFEAAISPWPEGVRDHLTKLATIALQKHEGVDA